MSCMLLFLDFLRQFNDMDLFAMLIFKSYGTSHYHRIVRYIQFMLQLELGTVR